MKIKCPYCGSGLIFKGKRTKYAKGWLQLPNQSIVKKCSVCEKSFRVYIKGSKIINKRLKRKKRGIKDILR